MKQPHRVVFLDGHAKGGLDDVWTTLFGEYHFIQHLPKGVGLCFEHAVFVPAGYKSTLFPDLDRPRCPRKDFGEEFSNFVLQQYNLQSVEPIRGNIVVIDRQPYVSHPRSDPTKFTRQSNNLDKLRARLETIPGVKVHLVRLETMSFGEQLKLIRQAHVLIGNHGAALSHLMFMEKSRSHVIEFTTDYLDFFTVLAEWKGMNIEMINLDYDGKLTSDIIERAFILVQGHMA
jgi:hypothetical protein